MARKKKQVEVPPPAERMCEKHSIYIMPARWRAGCRKRGCCACVRPWNKNAKKRYAASSARKATWRRYNVSDGARERTRYWKRSKRRKLKIQEGKI